jgi:NADP-dependent 3-hydroxy acid dehydrogenase YdfG
MKYLANKVAFVTGLASGIGLCTATALAQVGVKVMLADIEKAALDKAVEGLKRTNAAVDGLFTDTEFEPLFDARVAEIKKGFDRIRSRKPRH